MPYIVEFLTAAKDGKLVEMKKWHLQGANVNVKDIDGNSALHFAARNGDLAAMKWLVEEMHVTIVETNEKSETPLLLGSKNNNNEIVAYLNQYLEPAKKLISDIERRKKIDFKQYSLIILNAAFDLTYLNNNSHISAYIFSNLVNFKDIKIISPVELKLEEELGRGSSGIVYKAKFNHHVVAIKEIESDKESEIKKTIREIKFVAHLNSPYIVSCFGVCIEKSKYSLVLEYMSKGTLSKLICPISPDLTLERRYKIGIDIGEAIRYLHACGIIHGDIKSENILLDEDYNAKLCDLGNVLQKARTASLRHCSRKITGIAYGGTESWLAPEIARIGEGNKATDIYSYGMVLWQLVTGEHPFGDKIHYDIPKLRDEGVRPQLKPDTLPIIANLIRLCWAGNPAIRPSAVVIIDGLRQELRDSVKSQLSSLSSRQSLTSVSNDLIKPNSQNSELLLPPAPPITTELILNLNKVQESQNTEFNSRVNKKTHLKQANNEALLLTSLQAKNIEFLPILPVAIDDELESHDLRNQDLQSAVQVQAENNTELPSYKGRKMTMFAPPLPDSTTAFIGQMQNLGLSSKPVASKSSYVIGKYRVKQNIAGERIVDNTEDTIKVPRKLSL